MFDLRTSSSSATTADHDTPVRRGPVPEWADTLILELVLEGPPQRRVFVGPRGALAARLEASSCGL